MDECKKDIEKIIKKEQEWLASVMTSGADQAEELAGIRAELSKLKEQSKKLEPRPAFDEVSLEGQLSLGPAPEGRFAIQVRELELPAEAAASSRAAHASEKWRASERAKNRDASLSVRYQQLAKVPCFVRLRATATGNNLLMLKTNMEAGHGGASGRFDRLKEVAETQAFALPDGIKRIAFVLAKYFARFVYEVPAFDALFEAIHAAAEGCEFGLEFLLEALDDH